MSITRLSTVGVSGWPWARLRAAWLELEADCTRAGWREWEQLPALYAHNATILSLELRRRGQQDTLF